MPRRVMPQVGGAVTVMHLDASIDGVVSEVLEGGRRLLVDTEDGERTEFVLRGATATFTAQAESAWPRLRFSEPD